VLLLTICLLAVTGAAARESPGQCKETGVISEAALRKMATQTRLPYYPEDAKKQGHRGVAVAELKLDENNSVASVKILEAPSESIGKAVTEAINNWSFTPPSEGQPICIQGKLTFYFVIENGAASVRNPRRFSR
jgi:TonB family protein